MTGKRIGTLSLAIWISIAATLPGTAQSRSSDSEERFIDQCEGHTAVATTASQMLRRLEVAMQERRFLRPESFTAASLACVFGEYAYGLLPKSSQPSPPSKFDLEIAFQDAILKPRSRPDYTGLQAGHLFLSHPSPGHSQFDISLSIRAIDERFAIEKVLEIFGPPSEITDRPPRLGFHGRPEPGLPRDGLRNARLNFRSEAADGWSVITFETSSEGVVIGIAASGGETE